MTFNLLNTGVLTGKTISSFDSALYNKLPTSELVKLNTANILTADQVGQIVAGRFGTVGLNATATAAAAAAGMQATSTAPAAGTATSPGAVSEGGTLEAVVQTGDRSDLTDNRLRISALRGRENAIYGPNDRNRNILTPLYATGGMMFPYTPSIQVSGDTDWTPHALTHTNYDIYSYQRTPSATINLSGKFTVQNQREGEYALACIHFLRTMGKMYYGEQDSSDYNPNAQDQSKSNAGLPPPVMRLRGYGLYMFSDLKCVLKGFNYGFEETMDLVTIQSPTGADVMLPPMFSITVSLLLQQNPTELRKTFKLDEFRTGALMRQSKGWF